MVMFLILFHNWRFDTAFVVALTVLMMVIRLLPQCWRINFANMKLKIRAKLRRFV